jgi:hypothetical protein
MCGTSAVEDVHCQEFRLSISRLQRRHFFLYPEGHLGLIPVTFFVNFPFTQVIVTFFFDKLCALAIVDLAIASNAFSNDFSPLNSASKVSTSI